jgi:UDP-GlcNAc:undecaprenyl-phosphate GlcNAc-1-phosphate transferase
MMGAFSLLLALALGAILSFVIVFPERLLAERAGFLDTPDERRKHEGLKVRLGGPGMLLAFLAAILAAYRGFSPPLVGALIAAVLLTAAGSADDRRQALPEMSAKAQFLIQFVAACLVISFGVLIRDVRDPTAAGPFGGLIGLPPAAAVPLTMLWILGMINTVNFLDGVDGLAGGVVAIAALFLAMVSIKLGQPSLAVLCLALAGAAFGFLPHNFYPARIFMGTSGAWFLGLMLAVLSIIAGAKLTTTVLVIGVPVLDVALIIVLRAVAGQPFWQGDRRHLHHRLLDTGLSPRGTVLLYYGLSAAFGTYALLTTSNQAIGFGLKIYGLLGLVAVMAAILVFLRRRQAHLAGSRASQAPRAGESYHPNR